MARVACTGTAEPRPTTWAKRGDFWAGQGRTEGMETDTDALSDVTPGLDPMNGDQVWLTECCKGSRSRDARIIAHVVLVPAVGGGRRVRRQAERVEVQE